jgi:raffinose/stachyose/melibiose transport system permease protein
MGRLKNFFLGWGFIIPTMVLVVIFIAWPFIYAFNLAAYSTNGLTPGYFVGFGNFIALFKDPLFYHSFKVLGLYLVISVPLQTLAPLFGAKLIYSLKSDKLGYFFRVILVLPLIVPGMVSILVWQQIYFSDGALNSLLSAIGFGHVSISWVGDPNTALFALIFMAVPFIGGINMLIYLAGFMNLPNSLYEAAKLEGAGWWHIFKKIECPLLMPQVRISFILSIVGLIQYYDSVLVMTQGGPANSTLLTGYYMFENAFQFGKLGYATAIGIILFAICLILTFINLKFMKDRV